MVIPQISSAAWHIRKKELAAAAPGITRRKFIYNISRRAYRHEWKDRWREPGIGARILAFLIRILPKVGPLKVLAFKPPTPQTEKLFETSFDKTMEVYRALLKQPDLTQLQLADRDFDTGEATRPTEYWMADNCYAKLVIKLAERDPSSVDPKLRQNILAFYSNLDLPFRTRQDAEAVAADAGRAGQAESRSRPSPPEVPCGRIGFPARFPCSPIPKTTCTASRFRSRTLPTAWALRPTSTRARPSSTTTAPMTKRSAISRIPSATR